MPQINPPIKPFPEYKWRWATYEPTESLNTPPIFLGVLRVFNKFQNFAPGSKEIMDGLAIVAEETKSPVNLVRTQERNLIRNSGQYWKALGLLSEAQGKIQVSEFGQMFATGNLTEIEFAATIVKTLELPNRRIDENTAVWDNANLKIKPLELILNLLTNISTKFGASKAYITPFELVKIVIPLAGAKSPIEDFVDAIIQHRDGRLDVSNWVDCAPKANDKRMVREFLLFLSNYGFCKVIRPTRRNEDEQYFLANISKEEIVALQKLRIIPQQLDKIARKIRETHIPATVERKRVSRNILERTYQSAFRKNILTAFNSTCLITGVNLENVLEAAHIKPVEFNGSDKVENGLCLRTDIHRLFDSKHLRLMPTGEIIFSELASAINNYGKLPNRVDIPNFINKDFLDWRVKYT